MSCKSMQLSRSAEPAAARNVEIFNNMDLNKQSEEFRVPPKPRCFIQQDRSERSRKCELLIRQ